MDVLGGGAGEGQLSWGQMSGHPSSPLPAVSHSTPQTQSGVHISPLVDRSVVIKHVCECRRSHLRPPGDLLGVHAVNTVDRKKRGSTFDIITLENTLDFYNVCIAVSSVRAYVSYVFYFFEKYVRILTYSILAYVNNNRIRQQNLSLLTI